MGSASGEHAHGRGYRILVVEDEMLVAMDLELCLQESGYEVIGPAGSVAAALALIENQRPDAAVLDVSLRGEEVTPVAQVLRAMGVPFVLASAFSAADLDGNEALAGAQNLGKPTRIKRLLSALANLLH